MVRCTCTNECRKKKKNYEFFKIIILTGNETNFVYSWNWPNDKNYKRFEFIIRTYSYNVKSKIKYPNY